MLIPEIIRIATMTNQVITPQILRNSTNDSLFTRTNMMNIQKLAKNNSLNSPSELTQLHPKSKSQA
jgi:hypothetical protein